MVKFNPNLSILEFERDYKIYLSEQIIYLKSLRTNQYRRDNIHFFEELIKGDKHKIDYVVLYSHYLDMFKDFKFKDYSTTMILNFKGEFLK